MRPLFWTMALAFALAAPALAQSGDHLEIEAASTTYDGKAHVYRVKGNVRMTLPQIAVTCDEAVVHFTPKEDAVQRIVFSGHVVATKGTDTFRAERITYEVADRRLVAEGATRTRLKLPVAGSPAPKPGKM